MSKSKMRDRVRRRCQAQKDKEQGINKGSYFKFKKEVKYYNPKAGTVNLDIVPYKVTVKNNPEYDAGELADYREYFLHRNIGEEKQTVICPKKTIGKKCPICEERNKLMDNYEDNKLAIKALRPQPRVLYNLINLDDNQDVQIMSIAAFNFSKLLFEEIYEDRDAEGYADMIDGRTVKVRWKTDSYNGNEYSTASKIDFIKRDDYSEDILDKTFDLDDALVILPYEKLRQIFLDEDIEEDEEKPESEVEEEVEEVKKVEEVEVEENLNKQLKEETEFEKAVEEVKKVEEMKKRVRESKEATESKCPFYEEYQQKGITITFGKDANNPKLPCCDDCDEAIWNECYDLQEKMKKEEKSE